MSRVVIVFKNIIQMSKKKQQKLSEAASSLTAKYRSSLSTPPARPPRDATMTVC